MGAAPSHRHSPSPRKLPTRRAWAARVALLVNRPFLTESLHETPAPKGAAVSSAYVRPSRHPSFCDEILSLFPEENVKGWLAPNFLDCDSLRSAVARSFDTWAANHKRIYYTDDTAQCINATDNVCAAAEVCEHASLPHVKAADAPNTPNFAMIRSTFTPSEISRWRTT